MENKKRYKNKKKVEKGHRFRCMLANKETTSDIEHEGKLGKHVPNST